MSEASEYTANDHDSLSTEHLSLKIYKKLSCELNEPLAVAAHRTVASSLLKLKNALQCNQTLGEKARLLLVYSGVAVMRRRVVGVDPEYQLELLATTQALLFALIAMASAPRHTGNGVENEAGIEVQSPAEEEAGEADEVAEASDAGDSKSEGHAEPAEAAEPARRAKRKRATIRDSQQLLSAWSAASLSDRLSNSPKNSWVALLNDDSKLQESALSEVAFVGENDPQPMQSMEALSHIFLKSVANSSMHAALDSTPRSSAHCDTGAASFLTLDVASVLDSARQIQTDHVANLAEAAESEAGQALLRDILASFLLPAGLIGVRNKILISRETNKLATKNYSATVNHCHNVAMRGASWTFNNDEDETSRMAALLAGLALTLIRDRSDIKERCAFRGLVILPFIETVAPANDSCRLALISSSNTWVVFEQKNLKKPRVLFKKAGFDGFLECISVFLEKNK